jgi:hypothetical protein
MIIPAHVALLNEILAVPGFLADPVLVFGYQDVWPTEGRPESKPEILRYSDLNEYLRAVKGLKTVHTMDHFDPRSEIRHDMNEPIPPDAYEQYATLIDIGCLEHVFDTRMCLENCLRMVKVGGHYMMHAPINGYYGHGLHTFHPEGLLSALELNGFEIIFHKFSTIDGIEIIDPEKHRDALLWAVAKKIAPLGKFVSPQQGRWSTKYLDKMK